MEGEGFDRPDIVKTLSKQFQCAERTVYRDFQVRSKWQPQLTGHTDRTQAYFSILNRFEQIYQKASFTYQHAKNESVTIASLKVMLDTLSRIKELTGVCGSMGDGDRNITVGWTASNSDKAEISKRLNELLTEEEKQTLNTITRKRIAVGRSMDKQTGETLH